jgi:alkylation response protein AidB-like acyl-CoA dehydrogenase
MSLLLTEDQQILKQSAAEFVKNESPVSRVRHYRDDRDALGFSRELWTKMAELGWPAILLPESYGGLGMGYKDLACVLEECGRNLVPEPLLSTVLLGANTVLLAGSERQKQDLLPLVAAGRMLLALAYHERGARNDVHVVETRAIERDTTYVLNGSKALVIDGHAAERLIVSARTSGGAQDRDGITLFLVDAGAPGLRISRQWTVDARGAALVELSDVEVGRDSVLGELGAGGRVLEDVIDRATVGLCAEMLGTAAQAFEMTLAYLKVRKQFGVPIGSFQALKHRAAKMFIELELARSAVMGACAALDDSARNWRELVSLAKARCSDTAALVGYEGIQMHGGIGMTDEHDIGLYAKRARATEIMFGDAAHHRARFAGLQGY